MNSRRKFLQNSITLATGAAVASSLTGCGVGNEPLAKSVAETSYKSGGALPWINWAGNKSCVPSDRAAPTNEDELVSVLKGAKGQVRPVGSSHSFSGVVPTDQTLLTTDLMHGIIDHDPQTLQAEVWAGSRMHNLTPLLDGIGQALPNQPDMDYPSIGGAMATSVHGTGISFGSISSYVAGLTLATPAGELIECSAEKNADIFQAARANIGALGVVSRIRLQNTKPFNITEVSKIEYTSDLLENLDQHFSENRNFEFLPLPYTNLALSMYTNEAKPGDKNIGEDDPRAVNDIREAFDMTAWIPGIGTKLYDKALHAAIDMDAVSTTRTGRSFQVFPHDRIVRFSEMEYTVPVEVGPACLKEVLATIEKKKLPLSMPLEYRHVKADDIWLSMYEGQTGAAISVHQYADLKYKKIFAEIEPIFWKYGGRPHWGKIHTLDAKRLKALYPRHWQDFQEVRLALDPQGKMLNNHLRRIFGA